MLLFGVINWRRWIGFILAYSAKLVKALLAIYNAAHPARGIQRCE